MAGPTRLPRVAVLLSTYNGERFLDEQLASLRTQEDVEVLLHVRDDGSTDRTCEVLARYAETWPSLAEVRPGANLGAAASFLELLRTAPDDADYYAFCDQDDVWLPDKLARALKTLARSEGAALYCSNLTCVAENLCVLGVPPAHSDLRLQHLLFENIATGCTIVMNPAARALITERPPASGVVMHDWWCALVVTALGHVYYDPTARILYRQHGGNAVGVDVTLAVQNAKQVLRFVRNPKSFYPIHAQAAELLRLYGQEMTAHHRANLDRLVKSKRSWLARAGYALSGPVVRSRKLDAAVIRSLVLAGWY